MKLNALGRASIMRPLPIRGGGARAKRTSAQLLPKSQFLGNPVVGKRWSKPEEERTVTKASEVVTETASAAASITNLGEFCYLTHIFLITLPGSSEMPPDGSATQ